jgi:hypothetical protein
MGTTTTTFEYDGLPARAHAYPGPEARTGRQGKYSAGTE